MQKLRERGATALFTPLAKELFLGVLPVLDGLMFGFLTLKMGGIAIPNVSVVRVWLRWDLGRYVQVFHDVFPIQLCECFCPVWVEVET